MSIEKAKMFYRKITTWLNNCKNMYTKCEIISVKNFFNYQNHRALEIAVQGKNAIKVYIAWKLYFFYQCLKDFLRCYSQDVKTIKRFFSNFYNNLDFKNCKDKESIHVGR